MEPSSGQEAYQDEELFIQDDEDEDANELDDVIELELAKFHQQQAERYAELQAAGQWNALPLPSPAPVQQQLRAEERQQAVLSDHSWLEQERSEYVPPSTLSAQQQQQQQLASSNSHSSSTATPLKARPWTAVAPGHAAAGPPEHKTAYQHSEQDCGEGAGDGDDGVCADSEAAAEGVRAAETGAGAGAEADAAAAGVYTEETGAEADAVAARTEATKSEAAEDTPSTEPEETANADGAAASQLDIHGCDSLAAVPIDDDEAAAAASAAAAACATPDDYREEGNKEEQQQQLQLEEEEELLVEEAAAQQELNGAGVHAVEQQLEQQIQPTEREQLQHQGDQQEEQQELVEQLEGGYCEQQKEHVQMHQQEPSLQPKHQHQVAASISGQLQQLGSPRQEAASSSTGMAPEGSIAADNAIAEALPAAPAAAAVGESGGSSDSASSAAAEPQPSPHATAAAAAGAAEGEEGEDTAEALPANAAPVAAEDAEPGTVASPPAAEADTAADETAVFQQQSAAACEADPQDPQGGFYSPDQNPEVYSCEVHSKLCPEDEPEVVPSFTACIDPEDAAADDGFIYQDDGEDGGSSSCCSTPLAAAAAASAAAAPDSLGTCSAAAAAAAAPDSLGTCSAAPTAPTAGKSATHQSTSSLLAAEAVQGMHGMHAHGPSSSEAVQLDRHDVAISVAGSSNASTRGDSPQPDSTWWEQSNWLSGWQGCEDQQQALCGQAVSPAAAAGSMPRSGSLARSPQQQQQQQYTAVSHSYGERPVHSRHRLTGRHSPLLDAALRVSPGSSKVRPGSAPCHGTLSPSAKPSSSSGSRVWVPGGGAAATEQQLLQVYCQAAAAGAGVGGGAWGVSSMRQLQEGMPAGQGIGGSMCVQGVRPQTSHGRVGSSSSSATEAAAAAAASPSPPRRPAWQSPSGVSHAQAATASDGLLPAGDQPACSSGYSRLGQLRQQQGFRPRPCSADPGMRHSRSYEPVLQGSCSSSRRPSSSRVYSSQQQHQEQWLRGSMARPDSGQSWWGGECAGSDGSSRWALLQQQQQQHRQPAWDDSPIPLNTHKTVPIAAATQSSEVLLAQSNKAVGDSKGGAGQQCSWNGYAAVPARPCSALPARPRTAGAGEAGAIMREHPGCVGALHSSVGSSSSSVYLVDILQKIRQANSCCRRLGMGKQYSLAKSSKSRWQLEQIGVEVWEFVGDIHEQVGEHEEQKVSWVLKASLTLYQFNKQLERLIAKAAAAAAAAAGAAAGTAGQDCSGGYATADGQCGGSRGSSVFSSPAGSRSHSPDRSRPVSAAAVGMSNHHPQIEAVGQTDAANGWCRPSSRLSPRRQQQQQCQWQQEQQQRGWQQHQQLVVEAAATETEDGLGVGSSNTAILHNGEADSAGMVAASQGGQLLPYAVPPWLEEHL